MLNLDDGETHNVLKQLGEGTKVPMTLDPAITFDGLSIKRTYTL